MSNTITPKISVSLHQYIRKPRITTCIYPRWRKVLTVDTVEMGNGKISKIKTLSQDGKVLRTVFDYYNSNGHRVKSYDI